MPRKKPKRDDRDLFTDDLRSRLRAAGCVENRARGWPGWKLPSGAIVTEAEAVIWLTNREDKARHGP